MADYRATAGNDRAKALAAVALVHVALGAIIIAGLNVEAVTHVVERLRTFDIEEVVPPPPPPPPVQRTERAKEEEGAAGKKADPSPTVVPKPKIELPAKPPIPAAPVAGTGSATSAGPAMAGTGPGAGGAGTGRGGGGRGVGSLAAGPRLLSGGPTSADYRSFKVRVARFTQARVWLNITAQGRVSECLLVNRTGYPGIDSQLCNVLQPRMQWAPARDENGRPVQSGLYYIIPITRL